MYFVGFTIACERFVMAKIFVFWIVFLAFVSSLYGQPGVIRTVAGGGDAITFSGDGGPASEARLKRPADVYSDGKGNLYIADEANHRVRLVNSEGIITTFAGNGEGFKGPTGDGGPASLAGLQHPFKIFVAPDERVFISDHLKRIRLVDACGIITTLGGSDFEFFDGDGGPVSEASFQTPAGMVMDAVGNLYVTTSSHRIRKIDTQNIITTFAGDGFVESTEPNGRVGRFTGDGGAATLASLHFPRGLSIDASGFLYFSDWGNERIRTIDPQGNIFTVAGTGVVGLSGDGGPATRASFSRPDDTWVDRDGSLYIADTWNHVIRKVSRLGIITRVAGTGQSGFGGDGGQAVLAKLNFPFGVCTDSQGNVYIADEGNNRVRKIDTNGIITTFAGGGLGDNADARLADLESPSSVFRDANGNMYIADTDHHRIRHVDVHGVITTFAGTGIEGFGGDGGQASEAMFDQPAAVCGDGLGNLYVADRGNWRVCMIDVNGVITTVVGNGELGSDGDGGLAVDASLRSPFNLAMDAAGNLYVVDRSSHRVRVVNPEGVITTLAGKGSFGYSGDDGMATDALLAFPSGICIGSLGNVYIADQCNHRVRRVDSAGVITTEVGTGQSGFSGDGGQALEAQLSEPVDVSVDRSGSLFVADRGNAVVRKVFSNGIITTVAGNGISGFDSDFGMATDVSLDGPAGVFIDRRGDLYFVDQGNDRIRWVEQVAGGVPEIAVGTADFNGDRRVDFLDFVTFAQAFGSSDSTHDLNGNGAVDFPDFLAFAQAFGQDVE